MRPRKGAFPSCPSCTHLERNAPSPHERTPLCSLEEARATIAAWVRPPSSTPPLSPSAPASASPSRAPSRLGGLGTLAMGSASRLAFPRGHSPPVNANGGGSAGSGSACSDPGRGGSDPETIAAGLTGGGGGGGGGSEYELAWDAIEISEVSAKDDEGIEDVFLAVTRRLVERKAQIERERMMRERDSVHLGVGAMESALQAQEDQRAKGGSSWSCCA